MSTKREHPVAHVDKIIRTTEVVVEFMLPSWMMWTTREGSLKLCLGFSCGGFGEKNRWLFVPDEKDRPFQISFSIIQHVKLI
jgi:hypothetical protein